MPEGLSALGAPKCSVHAVQEFNPVVPVYDDLHPQYVDVDVGMDADADADPRACGGQSPYRSGTFQRTHWSNRSCR